NGFAAGFRQRQRLRAPRVPVHRVAGVLLQVWARLPRQPVLWRVLVFHGPLEYAPMSVPVLKLKRGEDRRLRAGHLWIFSNEVDTAATPLTRFEPGSIAQAHSDRDQFLGFAYVNPRTLIAARIVGRDAAYPLDASLLVHRLRVALALREQLYREPYYRLAFGESDGLPGLVLDRYGDVVVAQSGTAGIDRLREEIEAAIVKVV